MKDDEEEEVEGEEEEGDEKDGLDSREGELRVPGEGGEREEPVREVREDNEEMVEGEEEGEWSGVVVVGGNEFPGGALES